MFDDLAVARLALLWIEPTTTNDLGDFALKDAPHPGGIASTSR
jgi:hypothetical protein